MRIKSDVYGRSIGQQFVLESKFLRKFNKFKIMHFQTVVGFLKKYIFYEGGFNPTKDVLGISSYFQHPQSYTMVSQWGGYQNVADVHRDLDNWKTEPNTYSGLKNALHDLLYSWPDSSTTVSRVILQLPRCNVLNFIDIFRHDLSCSHQQSILKTSRLQANTYKASRNAAN